MRNFLRILVMILCYFPASAAWGADFLDGNDLYNDCQTDDTLCGGYVGGAVDAFQSMGVIGISKEKSKEVCLPNNATIEQITDVVKKYLSDNPNERQYTAASLVFSALQKAFPCP